jgi:hypothetical protein
MNNTVEIYINYREMYLCLLGNRLGLSKEPYCWTYINKSIISQTNLAIDTDYDPMVGAHDCITWQPNGHNHQQFDLFDDGSIETVIGGKKLSLDRNNRV